LARSLAMSSEGLNLPDEVFRYRTLLTDLRSYEVAEACCYGNTVKIFKPRHTASRLDWFGVGAHQSELVMIFSSLSLTPQASAGKEGFEIDKIRELVANHLDVDVSLVTDEAHFIEDLGADWLDRLELMILIEDQFPGVEITDYDADQMEVVGDLIRYLRMSLSTVDRLGRAPSSVAASSRITAEAFPFQKMSRPPVHTCRPAKDVNQRTNAPSNIRAMSSNERLLGHLRHE
jgi:acyl carrier protein